MMNNQIFEGYVREKDFAQQRGVTLRRLQQERQALEGPPFVTVGRSIYYPLDGIRAWLLARTVKTSAGRTPPASAKRTQNA